MSDIQPVDQISRIVLSKNIDLNSPEVQEVLDQYKRAVSRRVKSGNTMAAYESDWKHYTKWCDQMGLDALPSHLFTVLAYLNWFGTHPDPAKRLKSSTLTRRIAGIKFFHSDASAAFPGAEQGGQDPISDTLVAIAREQQSAPKKAKALSSKLLAQMVNAQPEDLKGTRDRAILLIGFLAALRRSEIAGLDLADIEFDDEGMIVHLMGSKTDQEGKGQKVYVPFSRNSSTCAVRQLRRWIKESGINDGPLFRRITRMGRVLEDGIYPQLVNQIVQESLDLIHEPSANYSAHSLRSGFATEAAKAGAPIRTIMKQTRHVRFETVEGYIQDGTGYADNGVNYLEAL